jgi:uncharacterized protein YecE (DUF72 family)
MDVAADFICCRLHGSRGSYRSGDNAEDRNAWAARVRGRTSGHRVDGDYAGPAKASGAPRDGFVYFDNTDKRHAPDNARAPMRRLGQDIPTRGAGPVVAL